MRKLLSLLILLVFISCGTANKQSADKQETGVEVAEVVVNVGGMHCDMCVASVTKGIIALEGIDSVLVNLSDSTAYVKYDVAKVELAEIEKAIEGRGYTIKK